MSTLRVNNITDTSGGSSNLSIPGVAEVWVNFNGQGTVAVRAALNVSSITDNGVGDYTVNFATAMVDSSYVVVGNHSPLWSTDQPFGLSIHSSVASGVYAESSSSASATRVVTGKQTGGVYDPKYVSVAIFR